MRNVTMKTILFGAIAGLMLVGCGKKKSQPLVEPTATTYTRSWVASIDYGNVVSTLPGSFVPGCIQEVNYKNNQTGKIEFQQLEFSSEVCPSNNAVAEAVSIRAKFHIKKDGAISQFYFDDEDKIFGEYSEQSSLNGDVKWFELTDLCTGSFTGNCVVTVESAKLKTIK